MINAVLEEILRRDNAIWVAPDGLNLVYATFNDSLVGEVKWNIYGGLTDSYSNSYPKEASMRYPKVNSVENL